MSDTLIILTAKYVSLVSQPCPSFFIGLQLTVYIYEYENKTHTVDCLYVCVGYEYETMPQQCIICVSGIAD